MSSSGPSANCQMRASQRKSLGRLHHIAPLPNLSLQVLDCAGVKRLAKLGMVTPPPGMSALDMNSAEDAVVGHTREVVEGFVLCGMEVCPRGV